MAKKEDNLSTTLHLHSNHARNIRYRVGFPPRLQRGASCRLAREELGTPSLVRSLFCQKDHQQSHSPAVVGKIEESSRSNDPHQYFEG